MAQTTVSATAQRLFARLQKANATLNLAHVEEGLDIAVDVYGTEMHWSGETLLAHALGTLDVLLPFEPDADAVIACLLHHAVGMHGWDLPAFERRFGAKLRSLVSGAHLLSYVTVRNRRTSLEDLRTILLTVSDDIRTVLITLCDRVHILNLVSSLEAEDQRRVSQDALQLFAPVAARLGIYSLKNALEDSAFPILYPADAERIASQMELLHARHGTDVLDRITVYLQEKLAEQSLEADVATRRKQPYSIFNKMRQKGITDVTEIYDYYACRVIVSAVEECYRCLGALHQFARPVAHRFKDYISFPKPNGYQSLHTTLANLPCAPQDAVIEVQVRTHQMHREAEYGVAAHWSYKAFGSTARAMEQVQLQRMLATQEPLEETGGESHFVDHIYVLTPGGDIVELPEGATPLDFAFRVHTDLGLAFRGARVNGSVVPIDYALENGDIVEILKRGTPQPSPHWFQLLKLSSSRAKLRRHFAAQDRPGLIVQGRGLVNELLRKHHLPLLDEDLTLLKICDNERLTYQQREDLLMKIGQGAERVSSLLTRLNALKDLRDRPAADEQELAPPGIPAARTVVLEGGVPMPTRFAQCCKPDEVNARNIVGVVSRAGIVIIHRRSCGMLRQANPERQVKAKWE